MRIALLQCEPPNLAEPAVVLSDRLTLLSEAVHAAKKSGADLLVTPECFLSGYNIGVIATQAASLTDDSPALAQVADLAASMNISLVVGYVSRSREEPDLHNVAACWSNTGEVLARYRKTHLFGDTDRSRFAAGDRLSPLIEIAGVRVALAICFDIEFPEFARAYADAGAQIVVVPTACMAPYDSVPMRLVPSRAEENGMFIAYANYCRNELDFEYTGLSCVCGPDGHDLARAQRDAVLITADVDPEQVATTRRVINYLNERRSDLYPSGQVND